jgi:BASS family bile acid:Na+ symporter
MSLATLIPFALRVSIAVIVFALGLHTDFRATTWLFRHPGLLLRSVLAMNVIMPLVAALLAASFTLHPAVKVALVTLSLSPVPPLVPMKELRAGGRSSYIFSLLAIEAALAILFVPGSVALFDKNLGWQARVSAFRVMLVVLITVLAPLSAGMLVRYFALALAERIARPVSCVATVLLAASAIPILFVAMPAIISLIGNGTLAAIAAFVIAGLAVGHYLGGPAMENRTVLALCASSRHPGVALTIAASNLPGERLVLAAVFLYLIVNSVISIPYTVCRRRRTPILIVEDGAEKRA